jgi:pyruvate dehydrogenase E1 component alpha subunit
MPEKTVVTFNVKRLEILDEQGNADESLMPPLDDGDIRRIHELLVLSRTYDERALSLQREGRIGTYPSILGQEAAQVGSAYALEKTDWVFPSFRETGMYITMGYPLHLLFQYWAGDERGLVAPEGLNILPVSVSVGTHIPHAAGAAMAARYRKDRIAVVAYFGEGGTSKGDFHEGFNIAGVFRLPVVFICQNNQWAISLPREKQTAACTLAQKAIAYGFEGIQVDGNDIFAVYAATRAAVDKARNGGGPTFIECHTYRMSDHTTADDAGRYRSREEVESWKYKDPISRLVKYMEKRGLITDGYLREVQERSTELIDQAVRKAENKTLPLAEDMFMHTCGELSKRQLKEMKVATDAED